MNGITSMFLPNQTCLQSLRMHTHYGMFDCELLFMHTLWNVRYMNCRYCILLQTFISPLWKTCTLTYVIYPSRGMTGI